MASPLDKLFWASRGHFGEDVLLSLLDGELPAMQARRVQKHIERCWTCRARRDQIEKTIRRVVNYRRRIVGPYLPPPPRGRENFLARLDELIESRKQPWWSRPARTILEMASQTMSPVIATVLVVSAAAIMLLFIWQRNLPLVSARELLDRAQASESRSTSAASPNGVVYQKVEIRTRSSKLERTIYRDLVGKRRPRRAVLDPAHEVIKQKVESAGVDWEEPLSARDFRNWHDHLPGVSDRVARSGGFLLSLTTSVPSGPIASETLTVRTDDFHPVGRTIEMRNEDRIEIAELNYAVLGWNDVNEALFQPLSPAAPVTASIHLPARVTAEQLDVAELQARLVLNRLNADATEQLEFTRSDFSVQITGVVEDTQRKKTFVAELRQVPHVTASIFSVEELNARRRSVSDTSTVKAYSVVGQISPLERYLKNLGKDQSVVDQLSRELLDAATSAKQESRTIDDLLQRFGADPNLDGPGRSAFEQLVRNHAVKLESALDAEDRTIGGNRLSTSAVHESVAAEKNNAETLLTAGDRNLTLCRELISSGGTIARAGDEIAAELLASNQDLRAILQRLSSNNKFSSQSANASPKRR